MRQDRKSNTNIEGNMYYAINILISFMAIIGCVLSFYNNSILWVLPFSFALLYIVFFDFIGVRHNWCSALIIGISFIRYSVLPVLYTAGLENNYVTYLSYGFSSLGLTIIVMFFEQISVFISLFFGIKNGLKKEQKFVNRKGAYYRFKDRGIASLAIIFLGLILLILNPTLIRGMGEAVVSRDNIGGSVEAVFQVSIIVMAIWLISNILKFKIKETTQLILIITIFAILIFLSSNMATSTSRNSLIINSIIMMVYINKFYKKRAKVFIPIIIISVIICFCLSSYYRFESYQISKNIVYSVIISMFSYQVLNAYFAGPTNIDVGLTMIGRFKDDLGLETFLTDFLANVPFLNKLVSGNNTVELYNYTMSHGIAYDQIIPLTIQSIAYGGFLFAPVLAGSVTYLAMKYYYKAQYATQNINFYCYLYIAIVFSMGTMLCVNSMAMLITMRVLSVLIIGWLNSKVVLSRRKGGCM